jgi:predicted phosphoribosyltransferase
MVMLFENRAHAGQLLAQRLIDYKDRNPLVLGIPRGAMPMAKIIADFLGGQLDVILVHKLGAPGQPELAIGAIDETGNYFLSGSGADIDDAHLDAERHDQFEILQKRRAQYTPLRPPIDPHDRISIIVDDGIATGSTITAALRAVRARKPKRLVAAAAVASSEAMRAMSDEADAVVCLNVPADFLAVGQFFRDFSQVSDQEVINILRATESQLPAGSC